MKKTKRCFMLEFTKAVASGNDFIVIDNRSKKIRQSLTLIAKRLTKVKDSIGADGILVLERSKTKNVDFKMRIFNPDGSEADMCGNGLRCIAMYAFRNKIAKADMVIETKAGILNANVLKNGFVRIGISEPKSLRVNFNISIDGIIHKVSFVNTGVPHAVYFVEDIDSTDVKHLGQKTRFHEEFRPYGTNVNFIEIIDSKNILVRTYERGVEDETLSCGTGSVASSLVSGLLKNCISPISVHTRSREILKVYFKKSEGIVSEVYLEGKANLVYDGRIFI